MQKLYGSIRALQLIVYPYLIEINYPPHTQLFMKAGIDIASIDVLGDFSEDNVLPVFDVKKTEPFS